MSIINKNIDQYLKNIAQEKIIGCLLYGPNILLNNFRFDIIAKSIVANLQNQFLVTYLENNQIKEDKGIICDEFLSIPMFAGRKLIIIRNPEKDTTEALKIITEIPDYANKSNNFILLVAGDLDKDSVLRKFIETSQYFVALPAYEEKEQDIHNFTSLELKKQQIKYDVAVVKAIIANVGKNRQLISEEINKIAIYLNGNSDLDLFTVQKVLGESQKSSGENLIQTFIADFANKKYQNCFESIAKLNENNIELIVLVRGLANYFTKLYFGKISLQLYKKDLQQIALEEKIFYPQQEQFFTQLQRFSHKFISKMLQKIEDLELDLKKNKLSPSLVFSSFIRGFLIKSNSA
jgi:DNA polymerase-3 subunit delta